MNKLFRKASVALAGLAMAVGVGFAIQSSPKLVEATNSAQAVLAYSGSTTTNMAGGANNAEAVGLSETDWTVTANKGKANNFPGLNKIGYIALYYNVDGCNSVEVSSARGFTINSIVVTYTHQDYNNAVVTVGGNTKTDSDQSTTTSTHAISSTSFTITNGNTSNVQVRISRIDINYDDPRTQLATPTPVYDRANKRITWETVTNAQSYKVKIDGGNYEEKTSPLSLAGYGLPDSSAHTFKIKAIGDGDLYFDSNEASLSFATLVHAGTVGDPYSVADARAAIDANYQISNVYVSGFVSSIPTPYSQEHSNITFNIVDSLGDDAFLQAFRCGGENADKVELRGGVTVSGNLTKYSSTYEFESGCQLTSWTYPKYSVVYDANGATGGDVPTDSTEYARNAEVTVAANTGNLVRTDFVFSGWNTKADGSGDHYDAGTSTFQIAANTTLYAEWTPAVPMIIVDDSYTGVVGDVYNLAFTYANFDEANLSVVSSNSNVLVGAITASDGNAHVAITLATVGSATLSFKNGEDELATCEVSVFYAYSWDLTIESYEEGVTENLITWKAPYAVMEGAKGNGSTAVNNYIPPTRTQSRLYTKNTLTITPSIGYTVGFIVFTVTTDGYATALANSTWTNASAVASTTTVTVTPVVGTNPMVATLGGQVGLTNVTIYYVEHWCESFLSTFTCSGVTVQNPDGAITVANPTDVWNSFAASIDDNLKAELRSLVANEGGNEKEQAMARYDLVVRKYGTGTYQDFIGRFAEGGVNYAFVAPMGGNNTPNVLLLVAITSFGLIAASGVFFALRKRKER